MRFLNGDGVILSNGGHWVLMTGINGSDFLVNDPGHRSNKKFTAA
jgi:hypothetical protein